VAQDGTMGKINWGRVVLCGFLTGFVWGFLYAFALPLVGGHEILGNAPGHGLGNVPGTSGAVRGILMISPLVLGISTMWLYAAIRPRYGPGPKTAVVAGFALWFFGTWVDLIWAALGAVPLGVLVGSLAASLPIILLAAVIGPWAYKE